MRKRIEYGILLCAMCLTLFFLIDQWRELHPFSRQVGLRYETGGLSVAQIEEHQKKEQEKKKSETDESAKAEEGIEITAWKMEKEQEVSWKETGRQTKGTVITVYGNMARVLPYSMEYGGFTFHEDTAGCVVSRGLAWKLFGAEDVVGNTVQYEGREFLIRGVLDMEDAVLAIYQTKKQEAMPYVEVWAQTEPPAARLEQIKSGLGIAGASYEFAGSFYCSIARILLSLPFWAAFCYFCSRFFQWCHRSERVPVGRYRKWYRIAGKVVMFLGIVIGMRLSISFTRDFIPVQWSDFSFWSEKWQEILEGIQGRGQFPGIYWEQEVIGRVKWIAGGVAALIVILVRSACIYKKKRVPNGTHGIDQI